MLMRMWRNRTLLHCLWKCKLVQPLWKRVLTFVNLGGIWYPSVLPVLISVFQRNRNRTGLIRTGQMCWRRQWQPIPVLLPGKYHGWRSLEGCSPWGRWGLDTTERLHFHFSLSCIGEGNGNPLLCSCLENPRDGEAWWAAVSGVAQSRSMGNHFKINVSNFHSCLNQPIKDCSPYNWLECAEGDPGASEWPRFLGHCYCSQSVSLWLRALGLWGRQVSK